MSAEVGAVASGISPTWGGRTADQDPCTEPNQRISLGSIPALLSRPSKRSETV